MSTDASRAIRLARRMNSSYGCYFCDVYTDDDEVVLDYWEEVELPSGIWAWRCDDCTASVELDEEE